ncbi:protein polyglycylase TTLL10 isoform X2 [Cheilinus undulatus]|uniref:protein polyglycylase TTLL10 isoform X2 n=1 Tax=Cheilinus undulatus TaxID=241271 RepID=UPI001BD1CD13|nr:protein polyglycylase TTLL10 isoform X2 [Cheilinus undulatus]
MEKEEVEVPCGQTQPLCSLRQEQPREEPLSSHDHNSIQEVISEGELEQSQREEILRFSHMTVSQELQHGGSGASKIEQNHPQSFSRDSSTLSHPDRGWERRVEEPRGSGPFFFFGGTNGAEIVSSYCERRGWKRVYNKHREDFRLKWCETKSPANYKNFREGEQLMYQIPNNKVLTTKIGLLSSLREYERVSSKVNHGRGLRRLKMEEFIPTTFRMDVKEERDAFFAQQEGLSFKENQMWICKPTGLNQGRGIFLLKSPEEVYAFRLKLQHAEDSQASRRMYHHQPQARIIQHYIQKPLLLKGKKFDVRSYLLIACTAPYMVFFRHGYVRLTCDLYDPSSNNLTAHLTNQYMQKKNPLYSRLKEETVWSMERFNTYVNERFQVAKGLPRDWVLGVFAKRMQQIMTHCFLAVKSKLDCRLGLFDLIGCDFMVDEEFKVWLLEMNCNPALHTNCDVLKEVIPSTVVETLDLTLEIFNKRRLRHKIFPLDSQGEFLLLYNGVFPPDSAPICRKGDRNSQFNHKRAKKAELRGSKSRAGGRTLPSATPDKSVSASESSQGQSHSKSSSPLPNSNSCSIQAERYKNHRPQGELKLRQCILHHNLKAADDIKHAESQEETRVKMPRSSTSEDVSFFDSLHSTMSASLPHTGSTAECGDRLESKEELGEETLSWVVWLLIRAACCGAVLRWSKTMALVQSLYVEIADSVAGKHRRVMAPSFPTWCLLHSQQRGREHQRA